jgi:hypothetical protein
MRADKCFPAFIQQQDIAGRNKIHATAVEGDVRIVVFADIDSLSLPNSLLDDTPHRRLERSCVRKPSYPISLHHRRPHQHRIPRHPHTLRALRNGPTNRLPRETRNTRTFLDGLSRNQPEPLPLSPQTLVLAMVWAKGKKGASTDECLGLRTQEPISIPHLLEPFTHHAPPPQSAVRSPQSAVRSPQQPQSAGQQQPHQPPPSNSAGEKNLCGKTVCRLSFFIASQNACSAAAAVSTPSEPRWYVIDFFEAGGPKKLANLR